MLTERTKVRLRVFTAGVVEYGTMARFARRKRKKRGYIDYVFHTHTHTSLSTPFTIFLLANLAMVPWFITPAVTNCFSCQSTLVIDTPWACEYFSWQWVILHLHTHET